MKETCAPNNTALHYSIIGHWNCKVQKKLLDLGADLLAENSADITPLSRIHPLILNDFLDEYCMSINEFNKHEKVEKGNRDISDCSDDSEDEIGINFSTCPIHFKYTFLAPEIASNDEKDNQKFVKDGEKNQEIKPVVPEMKVLLAISESDDYGMKKLVQHPVIKSYTWLKWKLLRTYFNRNIRIRTLLTFCLTWFIFAYYGGAVWNRNKMFSKLTGENATVQMTQGEFCSNHKFSFTSLWEVEKNSYTKDWYLLFVAHAFIQVFFILSDFRRQITARHYSSESDQEEDGTRQSKVTASLMDLFTFSLIVITLIGADRILWFVITILLVYQCVKEYLQVVSSFPEYFFHLENYFDVIQISTICFLLYAPNKLKDTSAFSVFRNEEDEEMWISECRVKRSLAAITILFSVVRLLMSIARHPGLERFGLYYMMLYRVTLSFLKFLFWYSSFVLAFGLSFYIIFHDDTKYSPKNNITEAAARKAESPRLIGYYTIRKINDSHDGQNINIEFSQPIEKEGDQKEETKFNIPYVSLMRTSVMFIGEIDFTDLPIHGGNISKTVVYLFILCFIFLMVMVLMNLLNGMAVSDTGQILNEAVILSQTKFIETLSYFEEVIFDNYAWQTMCYACLPKIQKCIKHRMQSAGILLLHSSLIGDTHNIRLPFALTSNESVNNANSQNEKLKRAETQRSTLALQSKGKRFSSKKMGGLWNKIKSFVIYQENQGSEDFLKEARKILYLQDYRKRHGYVKKQKDHEYFGPTGTYLTTWEQGRHNLGFHPATGSRSTSIEPR